MNDALPSSPDVLSPRGLKEVLREMPDFREQEIDRLHEAVANIEDREALARRIADFVHEQRDRFPDLPEEQEALVEHILAQLDGLQGELELERQEILRKTEKFEEIERDPAKKNLLGRAVEAVRGGLRFSWKHKWKILAVLTLIAGGVIGAYYWEELAALLGGWQGWGAGGGAAAGGAEAIAEAAGESGVLKVLIDGAGYAVETDGVMRAATLEEIVQLTETARETASGTDGIVVRVLKSRLAEEGARADLFKELMSVLEDRTQIQEITQFVD